MRRRRVRKVLVWGFLFVASVLAGAIGFAYTYITDSDTLAALIRDEAPRYLPGTRLQVDRVLLRPLVGDVELRGTTLWQRIDGANVAAVSIPWLQIRSDFRSLLWGKIATREVVVAQPVLRLRRRADGTWNLQGLLADPWPKTNLPKPTVTVSKGEIVLTDGPKPGPILSDVWLKVEPLGDGSYKFEGSGRGVVFERMALAGTFQPKTGRLVLSQGDLTAVTISDALKGRMPSAAREAMEKAGLERGEVDFSLRHLTRDPGAAVPLDYEVDITLRDGAWKCPKLPFPLAGVSATATVTPGRVKIEKGEGNDGKTVVRMGPSWLSADDVAGGPMDLDLRVEHLDLDERLKATTPAKLLKLWDDFSPPGRKNLGQVDASARVTRGRAGDEAKYALDVDVRDVAITYFQFKYPLEHVRGKLICKDKKILVKNFSTLSVGGRPLTCDGTIDDPGPNAVVKLVFHSDAMPVDETLLAALPPEASKVVREFRPEGSVRGDAVVTRVPSPGGDPRGKVRVDAELDMNEGCSIRWKGLPYPIRNLAGHLTLHPDQWIFKGMKGANNHAKIAGEGEVRQVTPGKFAVDLTLSGADLPFDRQLRESLPREWEKTWGVLNPVGSARVDARIVLGPGKPDDYKFTITPDPDTYVHLRLVPAPGTEVLSRSGDGTVVLPKMEGVTGTFKFDNGVVTMTDVDFTFRQAPVHLASGQVTLRNDGSFNLVANDLAIRGLRLESELRKIMPPVMAQFARKLDDGKTFFAHGNMAIGWSGGVNDPAVCSWDHARVVFNDNAIAAGIPIEHIQGEVRDVEGRFDGRALALKGVVDLESVDIRGQHLTHLSTPLTVGRDKASLTSVAADFLGGKLYGDVSVTLDATPRYEATVKIDGARLEDYARTVVGHQDYKGEVYARGTITGLGQDLKTIQGEGEVHVMRGDFSKLPIYVKLINPLNTILRPKRGGFDAADMTFTIANGQALLEPIKLTSDTLSLEGSGTVNRLGSLDVQFKAVLGRDESGLLRGLNDALRLVEGQIYVIHVGGTAALPKITLGPLPGVTRGAGAVFRKLGDRREAKSADGSRR